MKAPELRLNCFTADCNAKFFVIVSLILQISNKFSAVSNFSRRIEEVISLAVNKKE
jgi:hypothetical protein